MHKQEKAHSRRGRRHSSTTGTLEAEETLQETSLRFSELLDKAGYGVAIVEDGRIAFVNSSFARLTGDSPDEMAEMSFLHILEYDFREPAGAAQGSILGADRGISPIRVKLRSRDGTSRAVNASALSVQYHGRPAMMAILRDDTSLDRAEGQLRLLLENSPDYIMAIDRHGTIGYANRVAPSGTLQEVVGHSVYEHVQPEYHGMYRRYMSEVLELGNTVVFEVEAAGPGHSVARYESRLAPLKDNGNIAGAILISSDVTERKRTEWALRLSEERYRGIVERNFDGVVMLDPSGRITYVSPAASRIIGYELAEILGKHVGDFVPEEDMGRVIGDSKTVLEGGEVEGELLQILKKDGTLGLVEFNACPVFTRGVLTGVQGVYRDVTERERARAQLQEAYDRLEQRVAERTAELLEANERLRQEIENRKAAEEALRQSEEQFRSIWELAPDSMIITDMESGEIVTANPAASRLLRMPAGEIVGCHYGILSPLGRKRKAKDLFGDDIRRRRFALPVETEVRRADGTNVHVESSVQVIWLGGRWLNMAILRDISSRKRAEEAHRESEAKYRAVVDRARDGVVILQDGAIVFANSALAEMGGYSVRELVGTPFLDKIDQESRDTVAEMHARRLAGQEAPGLYEGRLLHKDGFAVDVEVSAGTIHYRGRLAGLAIIRDITARKAEQREKERHARRLEVLHAIADTIGQGLDVDEILDALVTKMSLLTAADAMAAFLIDAESGEVTLKAHRGFSPDCIAALQGLVLSSTEVNEAGRLTQPGLEADGKYTNVGVPSLRRALQNEDFGGVYCLPFLHSGQTTGCMITAYRSGWSFAAEDVALYEDMGKSIGAGLQRAILYSRDRELRRQLEREMRRRVDFIRALFHELKTPLTAAVASSDMLCDILTEDLSLTLANNLCRSIRNLDARTTQLLDIARNELGMIRLNLGPVDLLRVLRSIADDLQPVASSEGLYLSKVLPPCLPEVEADEERLRQVVFNLLGNALKFTPRGGTITIGARQEANEIVVTVEDTGPGISGAEQEQMFDLYYRGESARARSRGLGLGLALSNALVELHGGRIWVDSELGKGSTFSFSLPLEAVKTSVARA